MIAVPSAGPMWRATRLTPPTISDAVSDWLAVGLVEEIGQGASTGGKRPTLLSLVDDARERIGVPCHERGLASPPPARAAARALLAGNMMGFGDVLLDALRGELRQRIISALAQETEVGWVSTGNDIVLRGASALVIAQEAGLL